MHSTVLSLEEIRKKNMLDIGLTESDMWCLNIRAKVVLFGGIDLNKEYAPRLSRMADANIKYLMKALRRRLDREERAKKARAKKLEASYKREVAARQKIRLATKPTIEFTAQKQGQPSIKLLPMQLKPQEQIDKLLAKRTELEQRRSVLRAEKKRFHRGNNEFPLIVSELESVVKQLAEIPAQLDQARKELDRQKFNFAPAPAYNARTADFRLQRRA